MALHAMPKIYQQGKNVLMNNDDNCNNYTLHAIV